MEKLTQHLEQLIIQHDYAILPEFGGFIVNYVPAKIDETRNVISAPRKEIFFNPALNYNDGLLAGAIQLTENTTFRKANIIVRDLVEELKKSLKNGEIISLGKIGSLRLDENAQTEFIPADSYDFLPDNVGNYDIRLGTLNREEESRQIVLQLPTNKRRIYKIAAIFVVLVALAILTPMLHMRFSPYLAQINPLALFHMDSTSTDSTDLYLSRLTMDTTSTDSMNLHLANIPENNTELHKDSYSKATPITVCRPKYCQKTTNKASWHVIVASYTTKKEALNKARELKKLPALRNTCIAYSSVLRKSAVPAVTILSNQKKQATLKTWHIVVANFETPNKAASVAKKISLAEKMQIEAYGTNNVYRVIAGSYSSEKEADIKIAQIRKRAAFKTAWILHNPGLLNHPVLTKQTTVSKTTLPQVQKQKASTCNTPQINAGVWYVIIGNYITQKQAIAYAESVSKKERVTLSVVKDKKFYRVIAGSFNSQAAATAKIKELHKHKAFAEAWAFHK